MNNKILIAGIVAILLIIIYCNTRVVSIKSTVDNNVYKVSAGFSNKKEAADFIGRMNTDMIKFLRFLKLKYHIDETEEQISNCNNHAYMNKYTYGIVDRILNNYNFEAIYENNPRISSDTSYTISKGKSLHLCLRDRKQPNKFVPYDIFLFVALHELAHMGNSSFGHDTQFWETFKFVLHEATLANIYTPIDYRNNPVDYCGLIVEYNPLFDATLRDVWK